MVFTKYISLIKALPLVLPPTLLTQALASLAEAAHESAGGDEDPASYPLSPHFGSIIKELVGTADR